MNGYIGKFFSSSMSCILGPILIQRLLKFVSQYSQPTGCSQPMMVLHNSSTCWKGIHRLRKFLPLGHSTTILRTDSIENMASVDKQEPISEHEEVLHILVELHVDRAAMRNLMFTILQDIFDKSLSEFHASFEQILNRVLSFDTFLLLFKILSSIIDQYRGEPVRFYRAFFRR